MPNKDKSVNKLDILLGAEAPRRISNTYPLQAAVCRPHLAFKIQAVTLFCCMWVYITPSLYYKSCLTYACTVPSYYVVFLHYNLTQITLYVYQSPSHADVAYF